MLQPSSHNYVDRDEKVYETRKTRGGAILDMDDIIKTVLDDNDFVSVGMKFHNYVYKFILLGL